MTDLRGLYEELAKELNHLPMETNRVEVSLAISRALKKHNQKFRTDLFLEKVFEDC